MPSIEPGARRRAVHVIPHTHWDREWYAPFQVFRLRLVELLDELIPRLEDGSAGPHFLLDGQVATVDDYLEIRPEMADRLAALVTSGRLAIGPWYVLPDEFLVSGETLVRNLQLGMRRAASFGGWMPVGYLPDMFGHIAQMPQLLRLGCFEHAVVWRGVPSTVDRSAFLWIAPDGSTVRAEYLPEGYGNGERLAEHPASLVEDVARFEDAHAELLVGPILWMNGADHLHPAPHLVSSLRHTNEQQDEYAFEICTLAAHLAAAPRDELPVHHGELRSGARANLLMGVTSNRVDVRQAAAAAERALERVAEPACALFAEDVAWPARALELAWLEVVRNAAHDSICACSHDDVVLAVLTRYAEARQIAEALTERAIRRFGETVASAGTVVCNTTGQARRALVELDDDARVVSVPVPAFGWTVVDAASVTNTVVGAEPVWQVDDLTIDNGLVRVVVDPVTGTFSLGDLRGLGRLVDGGDEGDTYNWCPPAHDILVDAPTDVVVRALDASPARARLAIDRTYRLPSRVGDGERVDPIDGTVRTVVELRAGEPLARITVTLDNIWRDHRLRMYLPLPEHADRSEAGCSFALVERALVAEGGPNELGLPTYPARHFVRAGGLLVAFDAVTEYEVVEARELALTVVRATGMLSRGPMATRPLPAGPELPLEGAQMRGCVERRFAIARAAHVDPWDLVDAFTPCPTTAARGGGHRPATGSLLDVRGAEVSAVLRDDDGLVLRVYNPRPTSSMLSVDGRRGRIVDLRGAELGTFDGTIEVGRWQIATLTLE